MPKKAENKNESPLMSVSEVARYIRRPESFVYRAAAREELPIVKFGSRIMISRPALQRMLEEAGK